MLPFNAKLVDFVVNTQDVTEFGNIQKIGDMIVRETINFEKFFVFNFKEFDITNSFTHPSRLFEILDNGTYVVGGFVTKTIKITKTNEVIFDKRIDELQKIKLLFFSV